MVSFAARTRACSFNTSLPFALLLCACSGTEATPVGNTNTGDLGGSSSLGASTGGTAASGGASPLGSSSGGSSATGLTKGGTAASGGASPLGSSGGNPGTTGGRASTTGGARSSTAPPTGGTASSGTGKTTGGASSSATGGALASGGSSSSGGNAASGGRATGGASSSGGQKTTGGNGQAGGAVNTGGSVSSGGTTASGGSSSPCNVSPVDPAATPQAKNLLCYLYSIYKKSVLSGQQETSWNSDPSADVNYYNKLVSKYPAVLGGDYLYPSGTTSRAQAYWNAGGIPMLRYHMGAPPNSDTYDNSKLSYSSTQCSNVVTSGTTENTSLVSKLDYLAKELQILQSANVPVILALFHEVQQGGWFWWSKCSSSQFIALYKYSYDYLVKTKGIHNLIRLMPFSHTPTASYYPGATYVDIGGADEYANPATQPFGSLYGTCAGIFGSTMPIPLHETGTIPQPANMFPSAAPWLMWNVWASYYTGSFNGDDGQSYTFNTDNNIKAAYADARTITRDEVPNLK